MIKRTYFMCIYLKGDESYPKYASGICSYRSFRANPGRVKVKMQKDMLEWMEEQGYVYERFAPVAFNRC